MHISRIVAVAAFFGSTTFAAPVANPDPEAVMYNPWEHIRQTKPPAGNVKRTDFLPDVIKPTDREEKRWLSRREDVPAPPVVPDTHEPAPEEAAPGPAAKGIKSGPKLGGIKMPDMPGKKVKRERKFELKSVAAAPERMVKRERKFELKSVAPAPEKRDAAAEMVKRERKFELKSVAAAPEKVKVKRERKFELKSVAAAPEKRDFPSGRRFSFRQGVATAPEKA
ncbi:hypothetical protein TWF718_003985 [Orbilia javanica]|uniref:Uncharacterized protein n=1 Tax=Orbilia javanica TaxID=47235 RepID=A0AAN8RKF4_9PEZI